jgi:hypothetical protein
MHEPRDDVSLVGAPPEWTARLDDNNAWPFRAPRKLPLGRSVWSGVCSWARLHPYPESRIWRRLGAYHLLIRWLPLPSQKT